MTRRFYSAGLLLPLLLLASSCGGKRQLDIQNDEGGPAPKTLLASRLAMGDPATPPQLGNGFWSVENNAWRWTAGTFSVRLGVPAGAAQKGATLSLALVIPDSAIAKLHSQTLTASVAGKEIQSSKYTAAGPYTFTADVPEAALSKTSVTVDFALDNFQPPANGDKRELGVIVYSVALESK